MDTLTVLSITKNLDRLLAGKKILGLITVARDTFALISRGLPGGVVLRMGYPVGVYFDRSKLKPTRDFPPLADAYLLEGATVKKVEQYADDRIIRFVLDKDGVPLVFILELFRRPPSLYLVFEDDEAITIYGRRIDGEYTYPTDTTGDKITFSEITGDNINDILEGGDSDAALKDKVSYLSPRVAEYLAGKSAEYIYGVFRNTEKAIANGSGIVQLIKGRWAVFPAPVFNEYETRNFDDINEAVRFASSETSRVQRFEVIKAGIGRTLRNRRKKLEKQQAILSAELSDFEESEKMRELGDLLKSNYGKIKKGQNNITVDNFFTGEKIDIELNPAISPVANMEKYYKQYRKALTGKKKVESRLVYIKNELTDIYGKIRLVEEADIIEDIESLMPDTGSKRGKQSAPIVGRRYVSSDGFEIIVGRGAKENDAVTFGVGRPADLWLHAREARGSHVIVRRKEKGKPFPNRTKEEAAALAAFFSKSRNAEIVPVIVTERRYVTKVKGSPGLVRVMREEVIFVEPGEVLKPGRAEN